MSQTIEVFDNRRLTDVKAAMFLKGRALNPTICKQLVHDLPAALHANEQEFRDLLEYPSSASEPQAGDPFDNVNLSHLVPEHTAFLNNSRSSSCSSLPCCFFLATRNL